MTSCSLSGEMCCFLKWEFEKSLQVLRDEMGIRRNENLGVDFVTFGPKMGSHFIANALYILDKQLFDNVFLNQKRLLFLHRK